MRLMGKRHGASSLDAVGGIENVVAEEEGDC